MGKNPTNILVVPVKTTGISNQYKLQNSAFEYIQFFLDNKKGKKKHFQFHSFFLMLEHLPWDIPDYCCS